jgi:aminopeptidase N
MRSRKFGALAVCAIPALIIGCTTGTPAPPAPSPVPINPMPGAPGAGDDYYPNDGNGGYDALDYHVNIGYEPAGGHLDGDTTVTALATQDLSRFDLDLRGLDVSSVQVDGKPARFTRDGDFELVITPPTPLAVGTTFHTRVVYAGTPADTQHSGLTDNGWRKSESGGAYIVGEPHSAAFWYPVNDTPRDKATFHLTARVPDGWSVVSNGREEGTTSVGGWSTSSWNEPNPIASYLTTVAIDKFSVDRTTSPDGTPVVSAYAPGAEPRREAGSQLPAVLAFLTSKFGPYPQSAAGGIYLDENIPFSLETQTRPTYARWANLLVMVHENAHQWFGDSVSIKSWSDICLNECFASYAQWLWVEAKEGSDLDDRYRRAVELTRNSTDFWSPKLTDMGAGHEFQGVYDKGILAMHALRRQIGEDAFNRLLSGWPTQYKSGNASWGDFELFVSNLSGQRLGTFLDDWFRGTKIPDDADLYPGQLRG